MSTEEASTPVFHKFEYAVKHNLPASDLGSNLRSRLEDSLKDRYENTCFQGTYIREGSLSVLKKNIGHLSGSHFLGEVTYNVLFVCQAYKPVIGSQVQAQVISSNESGILCRSFPLEIPMEILMIKNHHEDMLDFFNRLRINSVVSVQILDYNIRYNYIYAIGRLIEEVDPMMTRKLPITKELNYKIVDIDLVPNTEPVWLSDDLKELRNRYMEDLEENRKFINTSKWQIIRSLTNQYELVAPEAVYLNHYRKLLPAGSIMTFKPPAISSDYYSLLEILFEFRLADENDMLKTLIIGGQVATSSSISRNTEDTGAVTEEAGADTEEANKDTEEAGAVTEEEAKSASPDTAKSASPDKDLPVPIGNGDPRGLLQSLIDYRKGKPNQIYSLGQAPWIESFETKYWNSVDEKIKDSVEVLEMEEFTDLSELYDKDYFEKTITDIQSALNIKADKNSRSNQGLDLIVAGLRPDITYFDEGQDREDYWGSEFRYQEVWLFEIFLSLSLQKHNGTLILAVADIFTNLSGEMLAVLTQYYDQVNVYKPKISQPSDSHRFVVATKFKGLNNPKNMVELGQQTMETWKKWRTDAPEKDFDSQRQSWDESPQYMESVFGFTLSADPSLIENLNMTIATLVDNQMKHLDTIAKVYKGSMNLSEALLQNEQKRKAEDWCNKYAFEQCDVDRIQIAVESETTLSKLPEPIRPVEVPETEKAPETEMEKTDKPETEKCEKIKPPSVKINSDGGLKNKLVEKTNKSKSPTSPKPPKSPKSPKPPKSPKSPKSITLIDSTIPEIEDEFSESDSEISGELITPTITSTTPKKKTKQPILKVKK